MVCGCCRCLNLLPLEGKPPFQYGRCAIVGNAQRALLSSDGVAIDHYEAVLRVNQAPAGEMASKFIGGKTTMRLLNQVGQLIAGSQRVLFAAGLARADHPLAGTAMVQGVRRRAAQGAVTGGQRLAGHEPRRPVHVSQDGHDDSQPAARRRALHALSLLRRPGGLNPS